MKHFLLFSLLLISACSVENTKRELLDEKVLDNLELFSSVSTMESQDQFNVTPQMVAKYLRLFSSEKTVKSIEPIMKSQDTLAYYVLYDNNCGWDLISGDTRTAPVIASSQSGVLNLQEKDDFAMGLIDNLLYLVEKNKLNNTNFNGLWGAILNTPNKRDSRPILKCIKVFNNERGLGEGMWIALDTTFRYHTTTPFQANSRLISTRWWQESPWYDYAPMINGVSCKLGCGPVAAGQIIYKYVDTTLATGTHPIPTNAYMLNGSIIFADSTIQGWSALAENMDDYGFVPCARTSIYLSWLGHRMGAVYGVNSTSTAPEDIDDILSNYVTYRGNILGNNETINPQTFCDTVLNSLDEGSPILLVFSPSAGNSHAFILDYYEVYAYQQVVRYQFDPYHTITEEELLHNPQWMFEWPVNYSNDQPEPEMVDISNIFDGVYVKFRWGYNQNNHYDNIRYLLRDRSYYENIIYEYFLPLSFTVGSTTYNQPVLWFHHFNRKNN